ncbi:MAG: hypothetical protein ABEL97_02000, partial [Salinibacter sp.]
MRFTYVRASASANPDSLASTLQTALPENVPSQWGEVGFLPLPDLYLSAVYETGGFKGRPRYLYLFGSVGLLILLIAGIN